MIVAKTPLRICFFGGGSDLPHYYDKKQGFCLSNTIDKYMYVSVCQTAMPGLKVVYNDVETVDNPRDIKHDRVREAFLEYGIDRGIEITSYAQIPTKGTGLGSSSTFTVGLVNALSTLKGIKLNRHDLAEKAFYIEFTKCKEYLGKQDQYAAAFGGMNAFYFNKDGVEVSPVCISSQSLQDLSNNLIMYYTGITRSASNILKNYESGDRTDSLDRMVAIGHEALDALYQHNFDKFGDMLDQTWREKRKLASGISTPELDNKYSYAIDSGALGGKILGAGGGGYFLFYVPKERQSKFRDRMISSNMQEFKFDLSDEGTKIVYAD